MQPPDFRSGGSATLSSCHSCHSGARGSASPEAIALPSLTPDGFGGERRAPYFKCFAKNAMLRGQAMSALALS